MVAGCANTSSTYRVDKRGAFTQFSDTRDVICSRCLSQIRKRSVTTKSGLTVILDDHQVHLVKKAHGGGRRTGKAGRGAAFKGLKGVNKRTKRKN